LAVASWQLQVGSCKWAVASWTVVDVATVSALVRLGAV
jgi:hypothetical protein